MNLHAAVALDEHQVIPRIREALRSARIKNLAFTRNLNQTLAGLKLLEQKHPERVKCRGVKDLTEHTRG
jgi:hypothetical protein